MKIKLTSLPIPLLVTFAFLACSPAEGIDGDGVNPKVCIPGEASACYSGPTGSQGVGTCVGGLTTCNDDGTAWSACVGEVTPTLEVCDNGLDDDCNGAIDDILDIDGDGYTRCDGDCCETLSECDDPPSVNPGAIEVIAEDGSESADENCNGIVDEVAMLCDDTLALDDPSALRAANAIDICQESMNGSYGIIDARYVRANGSPFTPSAQHGLQQSFGPNVLPRFGSSMLALSSGQARTPGQPQSCGSAHCSSNFGGTAPSGFPQNVPNCFGSSNINDDVSLKLTLRAPTNATGYSFDFMFYSFEYPEWVCTSYNDQFIALVDPAPAGAINGNIAFDSMTNPVSVNIAYFDVCSGCANGTAELAGTGFDTWNDAGATSWLRTQAPVDPGSEFTIQFTIWDTGDTSFDSTVLIDNFQWLATPVGVSTNPID